MPLPPQMTQAAGVTAPQTCFWPGWALCLSVSVCLTHTHTHTSRGPLTAPATTSFFIIWLRPAFGLRQQPGTSYACQTWDLSSVSICILFCFLFHGDFLCSVVMPLTRLLVRVSPSHPFFFLSLPPSLFPAPHVACDRPREERANQARR